MKKTKLILSVAVIVFSVMLCLSINAFALTEGDWEVQLLDDEVTITKYIGKDVDIVVPKTIYGCPVTRVNSYVFPDNVKSITFEAAIKEIPYPFLGYSQELEKVVLPEGLEVIGAQAFESCSKLKDINLPSTLKVIKGHAFPGCSSLESIVFPESLEEIGDGCFSGSGLKEIDMTHIKRFSGSYQFFECKQLKKVKLSETVNYVPTNMFSRCENLEEIEFPAVIETIQSNAFSWCFNLKNIILPTSLKKIEYDAFDRTALKEVVIPYGTKVIGDTAFANCSELYSVFIPETVNDMRSGMFANSPNAVVYCPKGSEVANFCKQNGISYLTDNSVNSGIHVYYNGKRISFHSYSQNPEILEGRTLVPLRSIFEEMGAEVSWDAATSTATAKRKNIEVKIQIGANEIYKNGKAIAVDVPAQLMNDRTMVPARVIAESFGAKVEWNGNGRAVLISE